MPIEQIIHDMEVKVVQRYDGGEGQPNKYIEDYILEISVLLPELSYPYTYWINLGDKFTFGTKEQRKEILKNNIWNFLKLLIRDDTERHRTVLNLMEKGDFSNVI